MQWLRDRPVDINELDEARRYHEQAYSEDEGSALQEEEELTAEALDNGDQQMPDASQQTQEGSAMGRQRERRKAPIRRRKSSNNTGVVPANGGAVAPMETNGVGDAG